MEIANSVNANVVPNMDIFDPEWGNGILVTNEKKQKNERVTIHNLGLNIASAQAGGCNPMAYKNNIYAEHNLGNTLSDEQLNAIKTGSFRNLFVGDYWVQLEPRIIWRIWGFDYFKRTGYETSFDTSHIIVVPDTVIGYSKFWDSVPSNNLMSNSAIDNWLVNNMENIASTVFSNHLLTVNIPYTINVQNNVAKVAKRNTKYGLLNSEMLYGITLREEFDVESKLPSTLLPLVKLTGSTFIHTDKHYWLSNCISNSKAAYSTALAVLTRSNGSETKGVRPWILVG